MWKVAGGGRGDVEAGRLDALEVVFAQGLWLSACRDWL
jgi:hypothetical protein